MDAIAAYLVKLIVISLILYSYYHFLLRNRLMHQWNRFFLLGIFLFSAGIPLLSLPDFFSGAPALPSVIPVGIFSEGTNISFTANAGKPTGFQWRDIILVSYAIISIGFAMSMLLALLRILRWSIPAHKTILNGVVLLHTDVKRTPFSFFRYIFWNAKIDINSAAGMQVMQHEMVHVRQWHSLDRLLVNMAMIVLWINPVFWLVRKELFLIHEFIADEKAIENKDADEFARMLLAATFPVQYATLTNHFFTSPIKRRLHMLTHLPKTRFEKLNRLFALPVFLFLILAFSVREKSGFQDQPTQMLPEIGSVPPNIIVNTLQDTVKASFPGGESAWLKYITKHIKKNIDSLQEAGKAGTAVVTFTVETTGTLTDLKITQMEGTLLAKVLLDAISKGPKWVPATKNGTKIRSFHKQPVTFQISND